jgi:putative salt-induced outer membrane protein YdiY
MIKKIFLLQALLLVYPFDLYANDIKEKDPWKASLGLSFVTASGNTESETLSLSAEANRKGENNKLELGGGIIYGTIDDEETTKYWHSKVKYDHDVFEKTYLFGLTTLEGNELAGYHLRLGVFGGAGYRFLEGTHELLAELGPGYIFEDRIKDDDLSFLTGRAYGKYVFHITEQTDFSQDIEYLIDFDDSDDYRINANTSLVIAFSEFISFKTNVNIQYVNMPPTDDLDETDIFTSTSLVFSY